MTCDSTNSNITKKTRKNIGMATRNSLRVEIYNRNKADKNNPFHVNFVEREYIHAKKRKLNATEKAYNKAKKQFDKYHQIHNPGIYFDFSTDDETDDYTTT